MIKTILSFLRSLRKKPSDDITSEQEIERHEKLVQEIGWQPRSHARDRAGVRCRA